jgi:hypothetical protein
MHSCSYHSQDLQDFRCHTNFAESVQNTRHAVCSCRSNMTWQYTARSRTSASFRPSPRRSVYTYREWISHTLLDTYNFDFDDSSSFCALRSVKVHRGRIQPRLHNSEKSLVKRAPRRGHEGPEGSRGITLLFLWSRHQMGVGGQRHAPAALLLGKRPGVGCAPGPVWIGAENLPPTRIRFPDRPARSEPLYRLRIPG